VQTADSTAIHCLTVSCFSKIQIGFTFLVPAHPGSPGQRAIKRMCVYVLILILIFYCVQKVLCNLLIVMLDLL